jgi:hypothetical protein
MVVALRLSFVREGEERTLEDNEKIINTEYDAARQGFYVTILTYVEF